MSLLLFAVGGWDHDGVGVDLGDAKVATEVNQIERTERSRDLDEIHVPRGADEDGDVVNLGAIEVQPEVSDRVMGLRA